MALSGEPEAARRMREALSLLPAVDGMSARDLREVLAAPLGLVVAAVRQVLAVAGPAPVLLVGGVARSPLLAELLDEAGIADVTVAARPDAAAVLGALGLPPSAGLVAPAPDDAAAAVAGGGAIAAPDRATTGPDMCPPTWLPPLPRPRRRRLRATVLAAAGAITVAALVAAGRSLAPESPTAVPSGVLVQYGYRLDVPSGWEHTGGLPERRRVLITPTEAPDGSDLIAVERSPLGYDAGAEPQRARAELRAEFDAAVAEGGALGDYRADVRFAGRTVTTYRQEGPDGTAVEWFVVLDGAAQLSVGCRHTAAGADRVRAACAVVVASVRRA
jgi:type VII secretion-associated protein (TIGR03931 family)